jgi:MurNAc alpha-1-phosphate uridylyltransferase
MSTFSRKAIFIPDHAMILAAGLGLRMRPLTETTPKPLVNVAGKPLITYILELLSRAEIRNVVVNIHHLPEQMRRFATGVKDQNIVLSDEEDRLLDSGGGIKLALGALGRKPFLVFNADSFWIDGPRPNIVRLSEAWNPAAMDVLLLVASGAQITGYAGKGDFVMSSDARLVRRPERQVAPFVYTGVALMKPELFKNTPDGPFSLNLIFDRAIESGRLFGMRLDGEWIHVGTPDAIVDAEQKLLRSVL